MKERMSTIILAALLLVLSAVSLFVGVIDVTPIELFRGNMEQLEIFLISRLPRLLAIICTGVGMSTAGLIMQQLCMNNVPQEIHKLILQKLHLKPVGSFTFLQVQGLCKLQIKVFIPRHIS